MVVMMVVNMWSVVHGRVSTLIARAAGVLLVAWSVSMMMMVVVCMVEVWMVWRSCLRRRSVTSTFC